MASLQGDECIIEVLHNLFEALSDFKYPETERRTKHLWMKKTISLIPRVILTIATICWNSDAAVALYMQVMAYYKHPYKILFVADPGYIKDYNAEFPLLVNAVMFTSAGTDS